MKNNVREVLYLSYTGMTDPLGQSQVLPYLNGLSKTGQYKFVLVSFEKAKNFAQLGDFIKEYCHESGIIWHPLSYTAKPPVWSTFKDVERMKKLTEKLANEYRFSLIHCRSYIAALAGLHLKKKFSIPFLFDMRSFWADERVEGGLWSLSNPLYRLIYKYFKKKERQFLRQSDHIISLTDNAKKEILSWKVNFPLAPITVIPCCVDIEIFDPTTIIEQQKIEAYNSLKIPVGATVISYLGSVGTWYMLDEMLAFVKRYQLAEPDSYFMILTHESELMIQKAAESANVDVSHLRVKKVQRKEVPIYLSLSKFSLFFIKPVFSKKASSPVKQGEIMAMGIPVVCNDGIGDTSEIVEKSSAGYVIREFSTIAYDKIIEELRTAVFDRSEIRKGAFDFFSLSNGISLYESVYKQMIK
ncbi:glycosyltransferase [Terrimonas pollutisoli]|uniref:glycosyltransferase n=1 Tax=Terrimonas pollutisoli TaxID=3034147 RepID=UPI0023ED61D3|nr:glycosyltransferase [Terrimonas sp. H1YJ31]